jgi:L-iditol 2-dehydrogenase
VIAVDLDDRKLELAQKLGAETGLNPKRHDVAAEVRSLTGGRGADLTIECVGAAAPIQTAIASLRKGGTLVLVGNITPKVEMPLQSIVTREIKLIGSCASVCDYPTCIDLLAHKMIDVEPLLSLAAPLAEGPALFARLYAGEPGLMKVVLRP